MEAEDAFSSDEAVEGLFATLEERAYNQERESDESVQHSMRIRTWQKNALSYVSRKSGSNVTEVAYAAYQEGITTLRETIDDDDVDALERMADLSFEIVGHKGDVRNEMDRAFGMIISEGIEDPNEEHGTVEYQTTFYFKDSAISMVKNDYEENAGFNPWIHRSIISIGFLASESLPDKAIDISEEVRENIREAYEDAIVDVEQMLRDFIVDNTFYWGREGMYESRLELIEEACGNMTTDAVDEVQDSVDYLRENAELIEDTEE